MAPSPPRRRPRSRAAALLLAASVLPYPCALAAPADAAESPLGGWTTLRLEGRKFLVATGRSDIARHDEACTAGERLVTVHSEARIFGASAGEHLAASVLAGSGPGTVTRRFVERSGDRKARVGEVSGSPPRFTIATFRPEDEDREQPVETWAEADRDEFEVGAGDGIGPVDPYGLLARLDALARAGSGIVRVLTKRGPAELGFKVAETRDESLRVRELDSGDVLRGTIRIALLDLFPPGGEDDATVLNMRGETRLWVDVSSGALVRIEGEHESAGGRLTMRLAGVGFGAPAAPDVRWPGGDAHGACGTRATVPEALDGAAGAS